MWIYQQALDSMYKVIVKNAKEFPCLEYCSKDQLQILWDENIWQLNNNIKLLERHDLTLGEETCIMNKIQAIENQLENIDYEWSRFTS